MIEQLNQMNFEEMTVADLKVVAAQCGLPVIHNEVKADLLGRVTLAVDTIRASQPTAQQERQRHANSVKQDQLPRDAAYHVRADGTPIFNLQETTPDQLRLALTKFDGRGFEAKIDEDEWHFRCKGAEDCGTMHQDIKIILRKAETVAAGARVPRVMKLGNDVTLMT